MAARKPVQLVADGCPWPNGFASSVVAGWLPGEVREVVPVPKTGKPKPGDLTEEEADRLLRDFPGVFVEVVVTKPAEPPVQK